MAIVQTWKSANTLQLWDQRTNVKFSIVFPFAEEKDFYSKDEMTDLVGHALERFQTHCSEKPDHVAMPKEQQHGLGRTLDEIKRSRQNRKELGGPKYHQLSRST